MALTAVRGLAFPGDLLSLCFDSQRFPALRGIVGCPELPC